MSRAVPLTVLRGGINRLRIRGGARADTLYDGLNCFVTQDGTVTPREGTIRDAELPDTTRGLCAFQEQLHTFAGEEVELPDGYVLHILHNPADADADEGNDTTLVEIHFAQPFMGALYVVAEWSDGAIVHYWLASSGPWEALTIYYADDVIVPTDPNGFLYRATPNNPLASAAVLWTPSTARAMGDRILPTVPNGFYFEVTEVQGDSPITGAFEPTWPTNEGAIVVEAAYAPNTTNASEASTSTPQTPNATQERYGSTGTQSSTDAAPQAAQPTVVNKWSPATLYQPGDLVTPRSATPAVPNAIPNGNFESGDMNWTKGTNWVITNVDHGNQSDGQPYQGAWYAQHTGITGSSIEMAVKVPVVAGQVVTATCYEAKNGDGGPAQSLQLRWYDDADVLVHTSYSDISTTDKHKSYRSFTVADITPGGATQLAAAYEVGATGNAGSIVSVDAFSWDYQNFAPVVADFTTYQATQAAAAFSASQEPIWPGEGNTVVDGGVTWLGGVASTIKYTAKPIMKSATPEPVWGLESGGTTADGTISWVATSGFVEQAPASKVVALAVKKIFAADDDIVKYSATTNPLDWTTAEDAGYLPIGLNTHGANPTKAMGLYRGRLVPFNSAGFQSWQVDEDPALMDFLDAIPVGSTYHKALQPVMNDLLFLTNLGYRNISIAGASTNLAAGGYGEPVDSLVVAKLRAGTYSPNSIFYPARGQYWGWFGPEVFVLTLNGKDGQVRPSWTRYVFPEAITDATLLGNDLYLRTATHKVWLVDDQTLIDDAHGDELELGTLFTGVIWWPHLDLGNMGVQKDLECFDLVCSGTVAVQIGYDQRSPSTLTTAYTVNGDTMPGTPIPLPVSAPSFSLKLTFAGNQAWEWQAANLYVADKGGAGALG